MYAIVIRKRILDSCGTLLFANSTYYDVENMDEASEILDNIYKSADAEAKVWPGRGNDTENYGDASIICIKKLKESD